VPLRDGFHGRRAERAPSARFRHRKDTTSESTSVPIPVERAKAETIFGFPAQAAPGAPVRRRPNRREPRHRGRLVKRIRAEFCEMPGLRVTVRQDARLFAIDHANCRRVLDECVRTG
jgi:hypothetical protein